MAFLIPSIAAGVLRRRWPTLLALLVLGSGTLQAEPTVPTREYEVKAVFLFHFAQFVTWPADTFASDQAPLIIGVLGENPFGTYLQETTHGEKADNHPLLIRHFQRLEEIDQCHILFISQSEDPNLEKIFSRLRDRHILTVGDVEGFAQRGGMIRFVSENNRIRFRINVEAAKAAALTISSKMLRPAEIITPGKD